MKKFLKKIVIFICIAMVFCDVSSTFSNEKQNEITNLKKCDEVNEDLGEKIDEEILETFIGEIEKEEDALEEMEENTSFLVETEEDYEEEEKKEENIFENETRTEIEDFSFVEDSIISNFEEIKIDESEEIEIEEETSFFEKSEGIFEEEERGGTILEKEDMMETEISSVVEESTITDFEEIKIDECEEVDNELEERILENEANKEEVIEVEQVNTNSDALIESSNSINKEKTENEITKNEIVMEQNLEIQIINSSTSAFHTLNSDWLDNASIEKEYITNIYVRKGGTLPMGVEFDIDISTGLKGYENGSDITIYVPNSEDIIYLNANFNQFVSLVSVEINAFDTSLITDMNSMFNNCISLESLDLSNFDTSNVTNMSFAFSECNSLESLDLSNFDTRQVADMSNMFYNSNNLVSLNLSSFDTTNVTDMCYMFYLCQNLTTITVSNEFDISNVIYSTDMFYECNSIVGGNLTTYDPSHIDVEYARIDTVSNPGYFTSSTYTVSFNTNGGSSIASLEVNIGDTIVKPSNPIKSGYTFIGWYKDLTLTNVWNFASDVVTTNIMLYAKWRKNSSSGNGGGGGGGSSVIPVYDSKELVVKPSGVLDNTDVWTTNMGIYQWIDGTCKIAYVLYNFYQDKFYFYDDNIMKMAEIYKYLEANEKVQFDNIVSNNVVTNQWVGISYLPDVITWYYVDNNGEKATGWELINGNIYYFNNEGKMLTGAQYIDNQLFHFNTIKGVDEGKLLIGA